MKKTDKKELRKFNTDMILEVYLSGEWYVIPKLSSDYMWEMSMSFKGESVVEWFDFRTFEMRPGKYRVLVPYYIEGNQTQYYTFAEFTCE